MERQEERSNGWHRRCPTIVLVVMLVGMVITLAGGRRVWLAPPRLEATFLVYAAAVWAWLPVWFACDFARYRARADAATPRRTRGLIALMIGAGLLVSCMICGTFVPIVQLSPFFSTWECRSEDAPAGLVRYTCEYESLESYTRYDLEGRKGWPIVFVVDIDARSR